MPKTQNEILAGRIVALEKAVKNLSSSTKLRYSSIDDFAIPVKVDGETRSTIGRQADGSTGVSVKKSPPPPQLTAPILSTGDIAGVFECRWDGRTFDGRTMPVVHGHTEIWAEKIADEWEPTVAPGPEGIRKGTIRDRAGGEDTIVLAEPGLWAVWLIAMGADRNTAGPWSPVSTVEVVPLVDTSEWQEQLDQARAEIAEAKETLEAGQEELGGRLEELGGRQETLREDLDTGLQDVYAEADRLAEAARDEAVAQAASAAQTEYDKLQAAAEAAQASADAVTDELGATSEAAQAAQARADEAVAAAEAAAQAASEAHTAAGNAEGLAASAYDRAGSQGSILGGLSGPSGTAPEDSYWIQWSSYLEDREVIGVWRREGGSWISQPVDPAFFPLVDIAAATVGDLEVERIRGLTAEFENLRVQSAYAARQIVGIPNLWADRDFSDFRDYGTGGLSPWRTIEGNPENLFNFSIHSSAGPGLLTGRSGQPVARMEIFCGQVTPGERLEFQYTLRRDAGVTEGFRIYAHHREEGGGDSVQTTTLFNEELGSQNSTSKDYTFSWEVPNNSDIRELWIELYTDHEAQGGSVRILSPVLNRELDGRFIAERSIQSPQIDTEEFFAAVAVIEKIYNDIVMSRLVQAEGIITEQMIATGAITTPKLTVTEEMVVEMAKFLRIEAGSLASNDIEAMRIVSSLIESSEYLIYDVDGNVSVRLNGTDNYISGRLHAGMREDSGIELDYRTVEVDNDDGSDPGEGDESEDTVSLLTPAMRFHTDHDHREIPRIWIGPAGNISLNPGRVGNLPQSATPFRVWGEAQANRFVGVRFQVPTSNPNYPGGMFRDGDRVRLYGRAPDWSHPWGTFTVGQLGPYNPSTGNYRGSIGFSAPAETGTRMPTTSGRMSRGSVEAWRSCTATVGGVTASGFAFSLSSSSTSTNMWITYNAVWQ